MTRTEGGVGEVRRPSGLVEDELGAASRRPDLIGTAHVPFHDFELGLEPGQIGPPPGREVIEYPDLIAAVDQPADEVRADEAGTSCDKDLHRGKPMPKTGLEMLNRPPCCAARRMESSSRPRSPYWWT